MKDRFSKFMNKLTDHFAGDRTAAYTAIGLFAAGFLAFIVNSVFLLASPIGAYRTLRVVLKAEMDLFWVAAAALGTKYYPTKRNTILIRTLIWYTLGDIAVMYSYPAGAVLYCVGHLYLMWALIDTTNVRKWQPAAMAVCLPLSLILLIVLVDDPLLISAGTLYAVIVVATMVLSLTNRFFWLAGIVFAVSDITGLLRLSFMNNDHTYFVTTSIYTAAFLMLCMSVYSTNRKEVVTLYDLFSMLNDSKAMHVSFWVCGRWALGLIRGDRRFSYDRIDLAMMSTAWMNSSHG